MFRGASSIVGLVLAAVVAVVLLVDAGLRAGMNETLLIAPWVLLALWAVYALIYAPHVRVDGGGIRIHNPLRIAEIPWARVTGVDMRWQLEVRTDEPRVYKAFAGPAPSRPGRTPLRRNDARGHRKPPAIRDFVLIEEAWESSRMKTAAGGIVRRSWDVPVVASLLCLLVWAAIALSISIGLG